MAMVAVVGDLVVDGLRREGLEVNGLRRTQGFQHGIKTLPRPLEQAAEPMDGDPVKGRTQAVVGGLELLPEDLRVQERFTRRDFGHIDVAVTITDPKTFTKSFTVNFVEKLLPDTDVFEHICLEDEKDVAHMAK